MQPRSCSDARCGRRTEGAGRDPAGAGRAPAHGAPAQQRARRLRKRSRAAGTARAAAQGLARRAHALAAGRTSVRSRLPGILGALAAPGSEARFQAIFDRQFAHAGRELHNTATSLGLFGAQYIERDGDYSDAERQHYVQLVAAASDWGAQAPLADRQRAKQSLGQLAAAARRTGLSSAEDFRKAGMADSLARMGGFAAAFKQVLARYGLDLDADLGTLDATLQQQTGDKALVRMRYRFAGRDIDTVVALSRIDGRWYLDDFMAHAEAAVARSTPRPASPAATTKAPATPARR